MSSVGVRTPRRGRKRSARGSVAVEFALIAPLLITLVFGAIDFTWMINRDMLVDNASRDGARAASLDGTYAQVCATVTNELKASGITVPASCNTTTANPTMITVDCIKADGTACNAGQSQTLYDQSIAAGATAVVTVTYLYSWVTPPMATVFGKTKKIYETTQMVVE